MTIPYQLQEYYWNQYRRRNAFLYRHISRIHNIYDVIHCYIAAGGDPRTNEDLKDYYYAALEENGGYDIFGLIEAEESTTDSQILLHKEEDKEV